MLLPRRAAAVLLLAVCSCAKKAPAPRYHSAAGGFQCEFPPGWRVIERDAGAMAVAPDQSSVSISFFPPRSAALSDPEDFVKEHTRAGGPRKIVPGPVIGGTVAGLRSTEFTRELSEPGDMARPNSPIVSKKEVYALVEAKNGFYAIVYSAPSGAFDLNQPQYQRLKDSFRAP